LFKNEPGKMNQGEKLIVIFRVEPGCLGPQGETHVDDFCFSAQKMVEADDTDIVNWKIMPRRDKKQPEMEFKLNNKLLTHTQAAKYLKLFNKNLTEFEECLHDKLANHIDEYLNH
jgi:hypothetical protein